MERPMLCPFCQLRKLNGQSVGQNRFNLRCLNCTFVKFFDFNINRDYLEFNLIESISLLDDLLVTEAGMENCEDIEYIMTNIENFYKDYDRRQLEGLGAK